MTTTVKPASYNLTVVGGTLQYGVFKVADATTGTVIGNYPGHFALNAAGSPVNPSTEDTQVLLLAAINALLAVFQNGIAIDAGVDNDTATNGVFGIGPGVVASTDLGLASTTVLAVSDLGLASQPVTATIDLGLASA